jgi:hypothetical protein
MMRQAYSVSGEDVEPWLDFATPFDRLRANGWGYNRTVPFDRLRPSGDCSFPLYCKQDIFIFYIQWLIFLLIGNTMKNTILRKGLTIF